MRDLNLCIERERKIFPTMKIAPSTQHMHTHIHTDNTLQLSVDRTEHRNQQQQRQEQNNITIGWVSEGIILKGKNEEEEERKRESYAHLKTFPIFHRCAFCDMCFVGRIRRLQPVISLITVVIAIAIPLFSNTRLFVYLFICHVPTTIAIRFK